jgi:hypothetical protein
MPERKTQNPARPCVSHRLSLLIPSLSRDEGGPNGNADSFDEFDLTGHCSGV